MSATTADPRIVMLRGQLREARDAIKLWEDRENLLKHEIVDWLTERGVDEAHDENHKPIVRYSIVHTERIDSKRLKERLPDVWHKFAKQSSYPRVDLP